ncbi:MAG: Crp/Fnr family transcriptional regulator, partial [Flavobacteriales bacterium]
MEDKELNPQIKYRHLFERVEVPAKTILLNEGEIAKYTYYIEKGCVRIWFNHQGKDITLNFFFEGDGVSSIESFREGKPSYYYLETLEPSIIYKIEREKFQFIREDSSTFKKKIEEETFKQLFMYQNLFLSRIRDSAEMRYKELVQNRPEIVKRIPQHYIATYLGITSVSLSRIRKN